MYQDLWSYQQVILLESRRCSLSLGSNPGRLGLGSALWADPLQGPVQPATVRPSTTKASQRGQQSTCVGLSSSQGPGCCAGVGCCVRSRAGPCVWDVWVPSTASGRLQLSGSFPAHSSSGSARSGPEAALPSGSIGSKGVPVECAEQGFCVFGEGRS